MGAAVNVTPSAGRFNTGFDTAAGALTVKTLTPENTSDIKEGEPL
ncbi:MAG: hypothetical protein BWY84_00551 [Candidatus Aerophobetes bacterium ADurb.Bin490]|nr:MAG: hypothetical protein BWY84_00551 [Candidatus Aerophobetes bacterium ADurb.Bin490]